MASTYKEKACFYGKRYYPLVEEISLKIFVYSVHV